MKTEVFDGEALAREILDKLKKEVVAFKKKPNLAVVSFGREPSPFIKKKKETAEFLGIGFKQYAFDESIGTKEFRRRLNQISKLDQISAIVVQLPLPESINSAVLNVIPPEKDPDLLSDKAVGLFFNNHSKIIPPTAGAIMAVLDKTGIELKDSTVSMFGFGKLVGRFLVKLLLEQKANVRVATQAMSNEEIKEFVAGSNIIVSAVGSPHFLNGKLLPEKAVVIDAGFSTLDGNIAGDIDFGEATDKLRLAVMVPGGVGPVGVAMLFKNVVQLFSHKK